jgi:hypothetical protein
MKKVATFALALLLATSLSFAQDTGPDKVKNTKGKTAPSTASTNKGTSGKKPRKSKPKKKNSNGNNYGGANGHNKPQ